MPVTRADLERRISELRAMARKLEADFNKVIGALEDAEYWLARLAEPEQRIEP